jgi:hypothetical protein
MNCSVNLEEWVFQIGFKKILTKILFLKINKSSILITINTIISNFTKENPIFNNPKKKYQKMSNFKSLWNFQLTLTLITMNQKGI